MKTSVNKFLGIFTGDLHQSLPKICLRFVLTNLLLFFILVIPMTYLISLVLTLTGNKDTVLEQLLFPLAMFVFITPVLAIISTIRVFRAAETNSKKIASLIILLLPFAIPSSFSYLDSLIGLMSKIF